MRKIHLLAILVILSQAVLGQGSPSGLPWGKSTGYYIWGYTQSDSGRIDARRDTNWLPSKIPTTVYWEHLGVDSAFWTYKKTTGKRWDKIGSTGSALGFTPVNLADSTLSTSPQYVTPYFIDAHGVKIDQTLNGTGYMVRNVNNNYYETFSDFFGQMIGVVGTTDNFPVHGEYTVANTNFINQQVAVYLNRLRLQENTDYTYNNSTGTITMVDSFKTDDLLQIDITPYVLKYAVTAQPSGGWVDMDYPSNSGNLSTTAHVWSSTSTSSSWCGIGLSAVNFTGDGRYITKYNSTDGYNNIIGFNLSNLGQDYTHYAYGIYLQPSGDITDVAGGTVGSARGTVTNGQWVALHRSGTTVTIEKSSDKISWTTVYTFGTTSSATLYMNMNIFCGTGVGFYKLYKPQYHL